jgi:3-dehydroquinate synthase
MPEIRLELPGRSHSYSVHVGPGILEQTNELLGFALYSGVFVITDTNLETHWLPKLKHISKNFQGTIAFQAGEKSKRLETVEKIWSAMLAAGCDRKSLVLLLGGGVVGDIGAFAASTYMRGVPFAHLPTSLLAQVDSSIGGKTGFDYSNIKNFIGTFAQPVAVVSDTEVLNSLPPRELVAGFAEMYRHGLIRDARFFKALSQKRPQDYTSGELADFIVTSVRIKASVVDEDETEQGPRKLINLGHTVGHAIEALSWETDHPLLHGEAVSIGLCIEADLSRRQGLIGLAEVKEISAALSHAGLPTHSPHLPIDRLMDEMRHDKKDERGQIEFTLLRDIGDAFYNQVVPDEVLTSAIADNMEPTRVA